MLSYKKICENCIDGANDICRAWENLYQRSLNYGEPITSPYDVITIDDIDGGYKEINDICKDVIRFEHTLSPQWVMINFYGHDCDDFNAVFQCHKREQPAMGEEQQGYFEHPTQPHDGDN